MKEEEKGMVRRSKDREISKRRCGVGRNQKKKTSFERSAIREKNK
jgi:hypothetical protein